MRIEELCNLAKRKRLDLLLVRHQASVRAIAGINCDNAILTISVSDRGKSAAVYTDFRYAAMVHRLAPGLKCCDIKRFVTLAKTKPRRIGYESSVAHSTFVAWKKLFKNAAFVEVDKDIAGMRAVKSADEIAGLRAAEKLNCQIWEMAKNRFRAGMSERRMAGIIKKLMIDYGDGEAFDTIVCVGKNAAECHHEPDDTIWNGRDAVLVDMGVKLNGFCSDLTRNLKPKRASVAYRKAYDLVLRANLSAIAAAKPGITGKRLDKIARDIIAKGGFGKCFGHSLGHGVGYEIHEAPYASKKSAMKLKSGMLVTIEPGIYLEHNFGVRIEDLVLITDTGCEVLSNSEK